MSALVCGEEKDEVVGRVLAAIGEGLGWDAGLVYDVEESGEALRPTAFWRAPGEEPWLDENGLRGLRLRRGEGLPGRAWDENALIYQRDLGEDARWLPIRPAARGRWSALLFPIGTGRAVYGVVALLSRKRPPGVVGGGGHETWQTLGRQLGQYFERLRVEQARRDAERRLRDELERQLAERSAALRAEIAERKRLESELLSSQTRFQALFNANIIGIVIADCDGRIEQANDEYLRIVGYTRAELERGELDWCRITPPDWAAADQAAVEQIRRTGSCAVYTKEYARRDGVRVPVLLGSAALDGSRTTCIVFALDDALRRRAELAVSEGRLRTLATHLQSVLEEQRTRLAREIHDVLGQELTGLKMDAAWVARRLGAPHVRLEPILERLDSMQAVIDGALGTVRRIATDLRPAVLDDLGLVSALEWQAREFERRSGLAVTFVGPGEEVAVDRARATALFRIFQELLTNIARHAEARAVGVRLATEDGQLGLEVRDDGRGIRDVELAAAGSLGLLGMRERAAALGGTVILESEPDQGTVARVTLPLSSERAP